MKIYCDESGYTGADYLEKSQPYFIYSGVKLDSKITNEIISLIYKNYNVQNGEIKGKLIVNNKKGRDIIQQIFRKYSKNVRIVFHDKKYVLAAKIIEYGIEPYLNSNDFFYKSKFNDFIATELYSSFILKNESAETLFKDFLLVLRGKKSFDESNFYSLSKENSLIKWIIDIMTYCPSVILDEIQTKEGQPEKWILDLTYTSLLGILTDWSKNGDVLDVTCDNSKVFINNPIIDAFNQMGLIGAKAEHLGVKLGFNLKGEIKTGESKNIVELQIADLFSSTVFYCLKNQKTEFSKEIMEIVVKNSICKPESFCVMPNINIQKKEYEKRKYFYNSLMYLIDQHIKAKYKTKA